MPNSIFRKGLVLGIVVFLIGISIVPSTANVININSITKDEFTLISLKSGKTLYVGGSGPNNYTKIQDAVDDASDGDTVFVYDDSSPYNENIVIEEKTIHLLGEDRNTTIIDMDFTDNGIRIENCDNGGSFSGFTFQNCIEYYGGFEIRRSHNYVIKNNIIKNNAYGILIVGDYNYIISNNIFINDGLRVLVSSGNTITDNIVNGKPLVYLENENNKIIDDAGQIILVNCDSITIENLDLSNTTNGIQLWNSHNCIISNNSLCSNDNAGIYIECSSYNLISDNYIASNSKKGIYMDGECTINNIIKNNLVELNKNIGIATHWCEYNTFTGNIIQENGLNSDDFECGLLLDCSMANNVKYNFIRNNTIGIYSAAGYKDIISNNQIEFNSISGIFCDNSWDNTIEKNNFIGNLCHATKEEYYSRTVDYWDRNFWERLINFGPYFIKVKYYPDESYNYFIVYEFDWNPAKEPYDIPDEDDYVPGIQSLKEGATSNNINKNSKGYSQQNINQQTTQQQTIRSNFLNRLIRR